MATDPAAVPVDADRSSGPPSQTGENVCPACGGSGRQADGAACPNCGGSGQVTETVGDA